MTRPKMNKTPRYCVIREGQPYLEIGIYKTRKGALAQGGTLGEVARIWYAIERKPRSK